MGFYLFWAEDWEIIKKKLGLILEDLYKMMFFLVLPENQLPIRFITMAMFSNNAWWGGGGGK